MLNGLFVVRIGIILFPVVSTIRPPDPIPLLQPHYRAFIAPTDRSAPALRIGTLASRFSPLVLLPWHQSTGSCSSTQKPASGSRPLYAGRRLPSHQAPDRLVPEEIHASGFDDIRFFSTRHRRVRFRSSPGRTPARSHAPSFCSNAHDHGFLPAAAWSGLGPAPESRSRGAHPHLSRSCTTHCHFLLLSPSFLCISAAHQSPGTGRFPAS